MASVESKFLSVSAGPSKEDLLSYLRSHQRKALERMSNGKILYGGVGSGKTPIAATYYALNEAPRDVIVITTAKKRDSFDWQEEFYRVGIGPKSGPSNSHHHVRRTTKIAESEQDLSLGDGLHSSSTLGSERHDNGVDGRSYLSGQKKVRSERGRDPNLVERFDTNSEGSRERGFGDSGTYPWVLTVDSWNNIAKYADVAGAFFIFDEQRLVGSGDWTRKFLRIAKRNHWILLSGTPGDTWMDYIPVFVANNFYKNRTDFKRQHVVYNTFTKFPKVDRYIGVGKLMKHRAELLVDMPYERHTTRHVVEVPLEFDKAKLDRVLKDRWHIYENRPLRDVAEMFSVGRKLVNSDPSRLEMVKELWKKHPKLIIFYNFNYELEILRTLAISNDTLKISSISSSKTSSKNTLLYGPGMIGSKTYLLPEVAMQSASVGWQRESKKRSSLMGFDGSLNSPDSLPPWSTETSYGQQSESSMRSRNARVALSTMEPVSGNSSILSDGMLPIIAEWNGHKHEPIPIGDRWLYLVQYTAGAEGWNCIETDAMLMYSRNYSWKILEQSFGRIDRLNTPFKDLWYYDFMSDSFIDRAIGRSLKAKETFNESKYKGLFAK